MGSGPPSRRRGRWLVRPSGALKPLGVVLLSVRGWEGTRPRREGRAESVPEAGGTGADAVATPTRPPAGHDAGLTRETGRPRPVVIGGRRENIRLLPL